MEEEKKEEGCCQNGYKHHHKCGGRKIIFLVLMALIIFSLGICFGSYHNRGQEFRGSSFNYEMLEGRRMNNRTFMESEGGCGMKNNNFNKDCDCPLRNQNLVPNFSTSTPVK